MLKVKDQELEQEYIPVSPLGYNVMKTCPNSLSLTSNLNQ